MSPLSDFGPSFGVALAVTVLATPILAALGLRIGWVDRRGGESASRKPRRRPVPLVGGLAVLFGLAAGSAAGGGPSLPWAALLGAFLLGLVDDVRPAGLGVGAKLLGQTVVAALLAGAPGLDPFERIVVGVLALVAQNAVNTFDHTDGAAGALALAGAWPLGAARGALLGFLPFNLRRRAGGEVPWTYLGDSGSHLLGVLLAVTPEGRAVLVLAVLDLARVAAVRIRCGEPPWKGDRRHLGHRLEAAGVSPLGTALVVVLLAAPALLGVHLFPDRPWAWGLGVAGTTALFCLAVARTPDPDPPPGPGASASSAPCPPARPGR